MKTPLFSTHVSLGGKMVDFCGWEMAVQYTGIIAEHTAVRERAGLFDVSHMGRVLVEGEDAESFLDYLSTNAIASRPSFSATYTVFCNNEGKAVDDVIIYKEDSTHFFVVVNASNRDKDLSHLQNHAKNYRVQIKDRFQEEGLIALQGPKAHQIAEAVFGVLPDLSPMHFVRISYKNEPIILSTTGYTGAGGYEFYLPNHLLSPLFQELLEKGAPFGIAPAGLGARDTLRLEMGYALYGHELSHSIAPTESVSRWTVKWKNRDFLGKTALETLEKSSFRRHAYAILLQGKAIARQDAAILKDGKIIGHATSGTFSPTLQKPIALILSNEPLTLGETVQVKIREQTVDANVVKLPFLGSR